MSKETKHHEQNVLMSIYSASIYLGTSDRCTQNKSLYKDRCFYNEENLTKSKSCSLCLKGTDYLEICTNKVAITGTYYISNACAILFEQFIGFTSTYRSKT